MQKTRSIVSLLAFTALAFVAAGCGGGGGGGNGGTAPIPGGGGGPTIAPPTQAPATNPPVPQQIAADPNHIEFTGTAHNASGTPIGRTNGTSPLLGNENGAASASISDGTDTCGITPGNDQNGQIDNSPGPTHHHHAFLGVISGGTQAIVPAAIGFVSPGAAPTGFFNSATCLYFTHTHDESGLIHIEPLVGGASDFTFSQFVAVWGQPVSSTQVGSLNGTVSAYVGTAGGLDPAGGGTYPVKSYTYVPDIMSQHLTSHTAIWLVVGTPPQSLPQVNFVPEF